VKFPLNSPLYTTFPLFSPLSAIIFPSPPPFPPLDLGVKKAPTVWSGLGEVWLVTESYVDPSALPGVLREICGLIYCGYALASDG